MDATSLNEALCANYMLVDMQLRSWSGKRTDREASDELIVSKHASRDAGAFVKNLLASAGKELKEVHTMGNAMRTFVYDSTLPWSSSDGAKRGKRLLATTKALTFLGELNSRKAEYDNAIMQLVNVWDERVAQAMQNLGSLADASDYPQASAVSGMFSVSVDLEPIPAVADFGRLNVPADLANALGERYKLLAQAQVENAMGDLRERFVTELSRIETQMAKVAAGEKTRLYETLITNMQVLTDMAKTMNLTGNPKLDSLIASIEGRLLHRPVSAYKENPVAAGELASTAKALATEAAMEEVWN